MLNNRLVKVNLMTGGVVVEEIPLQWLEAMIGGSGLAARLLWESNAAELPPLHPDSPIIFSTGPLTGTGGPTTGRFAICGRSPQTGIWGESNIGGFVGPELRLAGFDVLWVEGRSETPVYLWIHNGNIQIRPAAHLWGRSDIYETQTRIREELAEPQAKVACIGRAGENQVVFASILSDHGRAAGRTGMGALMGSKNLKAVAVRGTGKIPLSKPDEYKISRVQANKDLLQQNMTEIFRSTGTSGAADYLQIMGDMPQKYWTQATFENAGNIGGGEMAGTILVGTAACQGCVISCGRVVEINQGPYVTRGKAKGPEYETICSFGSQLLVDDLALITALGDRCDRLGLDTISTGNTIALAYLLFDRGILTSTDTGGTELRWGDATPCFDLIEQIASKSGFGELLAQGSRAFARHFGVEELAVQINGLDIAMHDPRAFSGQSLSYMTSPRGACHNQSDYFSIELGGSMDSLGIPMTDRFTDSGKAGLVARHQYWRTVNNCLVNCMFAVVEPQTIATLMTQASGQEWTVDRLLEAGQRAWNLKRAFNLRCGWSVREEKFPALLLQPLVDGGQEGHVPDIETMRKEYYKANEWDMHTGKPGDEILSRLGLQFVTEKLNR